jgi:hypothetical protein
MKKPGHFHPSAFILHPSLSAGRVIPACFWRGESSGRISLVKRARQKHASRGMTAARTIEHLCAIFQPAFFNFAISRERNIPPAYLCFLIFVTKFFVCDMTKFVT